jgi:hypothetical protein
MPKALIAKMKRGYANSGLSDEEVNHRVYGFLNKRGMLHDRGSEGNDSHKAIKRARSSARAAKYKARQE